MPVLGPEGAAELHRRMAEHTAAMAEKLTDILPVSLFVFHQGGSARLMTRWLGNRIAPVQQVSGDLGEKICAAFRLIFRMGFTRVVAVGTDIPGLDVSIMDRAFRLLEKTDVVIGPAMDGGYYLIGLSEEHPALFLDIPWGSGKVMEATRNAAWRNGLSITSLKPLRDIDRPEDLFQTTFRQESHRKGH